MSESGILKAIEQVKKASYSKRGSMPLKESETLKIGDPSIEFVINDAMLSEARESNPRIRKLPGVKKSSLYSYAKELAPEISNQPRQRSARRMQALLDMFGAISHAVISAAIQNPIGFCDGRVQRIKPYNCYNIDAVSSFAGSKLNYRVRCAAGTKASLKKKGLSISINKDKEKQRVIKQLYVTSSDGYVLVAVILISDNHISELSRHLLDKYSGGYELWVILIPNTNKNIGSKSSSTAISKEADDLEDLETLDDENGFDDFVDDSGSASEISSIDVSVMEAILCDIVLPAMEKRRMRYDNGAESSTSKNSLSSLSNAIQDSAEFVPASDAEVKYIGECILLMFDGDFAQIEATFRKFISVCNKNGIEIQKIPGGGSLQWQPNDLMRAHNIIHNFLNSSAYSRPEEYPSPHYMTRFQKLLLDANIEKASRDCFENFMRQIPVIISKAFTVSNIQSGWRSAGYIPNIDIEIILSHCLRWDTEFEDAERERILKAVSKLAESASISGVCTDEEIGNELGDLVDTELKNVSSLCINRQRGLWMNADGNMKPGVSDLRKAEVLKRLELIDKKEKAANAKEKKRKLKSAEEKTKNSSINYVINASVNCFCSNECSHIPRICTEERDDGWRGCPVCLKMYCNKVNCQKKLYHHALFCLTHRELNLTE